MIKRDEYIRKVRGLAIVSLAPPVFHLTIDLGYGMTITHTVIVSSPVLEALPDSTLLRRLFDRPGVRVMVQTTQAPTHPTRIPQEIPTQAEIYVDDEPLGRAVSRLLAIDAGEIPL
jgi:hypothetical protein